MAERSATIASRVGLHARPASIFVAAVREQPVAVTIEKPGGAAMPASSILTLLGLGAAHGDTVVLRASGDGADDALAALAAVLETDLDTE